MPDSEAIRKGRDEFMLTERRIRTHTASLGVKTVAAVLTSLLDVAFIESQKQCDRCHRSTEMAVAASIDVNRLKTALRSVQYSASDRNDIRELCQTFTESFNGNDDTYSLFAGALSILYKELDRVL